jgi:hypothetical protein
LLAFSPHAVHKMDTRRTDYMSDTAVDLNVRVVRLERDLQRLSDEVAMLRSLVDPDDVRALEEMRRKPVTNEQLRVWVQQSTIPDGLADQPEEKPW